MPRWDTSIHPKYRVIEMQMLRQHLQRKMGIDTSQISDQDFMDHMVEIQNRFAGIKAECRSILGVFETMGVPEDSGL